MSDISRNPPLPPFNKGGMGGFPAHLGLIQNAAFDHVNLLWPFYIIRRVKRKNLLISLEPGLGQQVMGLF